MNNIFDIKTELLDIFSEIEENDGELTPELEEQLAISQKDFTDKVRSYTKVIQSIEADNTAIDKEILRLKAYKESKLKTIERIKKILVEAIELFGDTSKSGSKFVDFGDGKVSIRKSTSVEVDTKEIQGIATTFIDMILNLGVTNQLKMTEKVNQDDLKELATRHKELINGEECDVPIVFTKEDLENFDGEITFKTKFAKLLDEECFNLLKNIIEKVGVFNIKATASKTELKKALVDENANITFATTVNNKNVTIK